MDKVVGITFYYAVVATVIFAWSLIPLIVVSEIIQWWKNR
jgi:hypothetical protein